MLASTHFRDLGLLRSLGPTSALMPQFDQRQACFGPTCGSYQHVRRICRADFAARARRVPVYSGLSYRRGTPLLPRARTTVGAMRGARISRTRGAV
jgi:hypothetical protein